MNPVAIHLGTVHGFEHFEIRVGKKKGELWALPGMEEEAIFEAIMELEMFK